MKSFASEIFKNIPQNSKIAIYGAEGVKPFLFLNFIKNNRKDIKVLYFINSFKKGEFEGYDVVLPCEIKEKEVDFIIVISDTSYREICTTIRTYAKTPVILTKDYKQLFYYENAMRLLKEKEDRVLYELVVKAAQTNNYDDLKKYLKKIYKFDKPHLNQYFDFINKENIETVISGGGFNGATALAFKYEFPYLKKNYMFEPLYSLFKQPAFDEILQKSDWCSIEEYGLWNKKDELEINLSNSGSRIGNYGNENSEKKVIKTISIDEFAKMNNIEKIDFIKMDIEGSEIRAIEGAIETLKKNRPQLAISLYHSLTDYYEIPLFLDSILENYVYRLGHYTAGRFETVLYAIPKEFYIPSKITVA